MTVAVQLTVQFNALSYFAMKNIDLAVESIEHPEKYAPVSQVQSAKRSRSRTQRRPWKIGARGRGFKGDCQEVKRMIATNGSFHISVVSCRTTAQSRVGT